MQKFSFLFLIVAVFFAVYSSAAPSNKNGFFRRLTNKARNPNKILENTSGSTFHSSQFEPIYTRYDRGNLINEELNKRVNELIPQVYSHVVTLPLSKHIMEKISYEYIDNIQVLVGYCCSNNVCHPKNLPFIIKFMDVYTNYYLASEVFTKYIDTKRTAGKTKKEIIKSKYVTGDGLTPEVIAVVPDERLIKAVAFLIRNTGSEISSHTNEGVEEALNSYKMSLFDFVTTAYHNLLLEDSQSIAIFAAGMKVFTNLWVYTNILKDS